MNTLNTIVDGVNDPKSIIAAAGATASVASNSAQMPLSNQMMGCNAIEMMGEKAKQFVSEDTGVIVELASSMLGAGANMFNAAYQNVPKVVENRTDISVLVKGFYILIN